MLDRLDHRAFEVEDTRDLGGEPERLPVQQRVRADRLEARVARVDQGVQRALVPHDIQRRVGPAARVDGAEDSADAALRAGGVDPLHQLGRARRLASLTHVGLRIQPEELVEREVVHDLHDVPGLADPAADVLLEVPLHAVEVREINTLGRR